MELGKNKSRIAQLSGHDWKTVSKLIKQIDNGREKLIRKEQASRIDPYKEEVVQMLEDGLSGVRLHEEISAHRFSGGYEIVKKYVSKLKRKKNIFVRVHTPAGQ